MGVVSISPLSHSPGCFRVTIAGKVLNAIEHESAGELGFQLTRAELVDLMREGLAALIDSKQN